jgi:hypothetical protein
MQNFQQSQTKNSFQLHGFATNESEIHDCLFVDTYHRAYTLGYPC